MNNDIIKYVAEEVKRVCYHENNRFGEGIWADHILEVVRHSRNLARLLGADEEIVILSAYLHDYAAIMNYNFYKEHHVYGALEAERMLSRLNYDRDKLELIKDAIYSHRGSVLIKKSTRESICLASADAMAHITQLPSLLKYVYQIRSMEAKEGAKWVENKLDRSWNKICPEGRELVEATYVDAKKILRTVES